MVDATIVVPTKNRKILLKRCLNALFQQNYKSKKIEIIIVDDFSTDGTLQFLEELKHKTLFNLKIIKGKGQGPSVARNLGWRSGLGEIILFTDDDCEPSTSWVKEILDAFEKNPHFSGIGGKILGNKKSLICRYIDSAGILAHPGMQNEANYLVSANAAFRRKNLEEVEGFSENFPIAGGEDPDLAFRMKKQGKKLGFITKAIVYHNHPKNIFDLYKMGKRYGRGEYFLKQSGHHQLIKDRSLLMLFRDLKKMFIKNVVHQKHNNNPKIFFMYEVIFQWALLKGFQFQRKYN